MKRIMWRTNDVINHFPSTDPRNNKMMPCLIIIWIVRVTVPITSQICPESINRKINSSDKDYYNTKQRDDIAAYRNDKKTGSNYDPASNTSSFVSDIDQENDADSPLPMPMSSKGTKHDDARVFKLITLQITWGSKMKHQHAPIVVAAIVAEIINTNTCS